MGIARRAAPGAAMTVHESCSIELRRGIPEENRKAGKREVTLLAQEAWRVACKEVGIELPWWGRRANILTEGIDLQQTLDADVHLGEVVLRITGETKPCGIMEDLHAGLRQALEPQMRGGVFGQVVTGGTVRVGDLIQVRR
jgi:MOSC domain-containing protein YiiM